MQCAMCLYAVHCAASIMSTAFCSRLRYDADATQRTTALRLLFALYNLYLIWQRCDLKLWRRRLQRRHRKVYTRAVHKNNRLYYAMLHKIVCACVCVSQRRRRCSIINKCAKASKVHVKYVFVCECSETLRRHRRHITYIFLAQKFC